MGHGATLQRVKISPKEFVPADKVAFVASAFVHETRSVNDRTIVLIAGESAKGTMAILFNSMQEVAIFYKYARTKFFTTLCLGRLSSHNAYPSAYQDIPMFSFDKTDPIDWSKSIPEIDNQLISHFGLEDYREYILSASMPYARELGQEYLDRLSEANVDVSGINEWY